MVAGGERLAGRIGGRWLDRRDLPCLKVISLGLDWLVLTGSESAVLRGARAWINVRSGRRDDHARRSAVTLDLGPSLRLGARVCRLCIVASPAITFVFSKRFPRTDGVDRKSRQARFYHIKQVV